MYYITISIQFYYLDCKFTPDDAWLIVSWVCLSQYDTNSLHCVDTLPDHSAHGAAGRVLNQSSEEWHLGEISVVLLKVLKRGLGKVKLRKLTSKRNEPA